MATRSICTAKRCFSSVFSRSYSSLSIKSPSSQLSSISRLRPIAAFADNFHQIAPAAAIVRGFATRQTTSSLNDSNPNWSNRPPKETILLDGCDFEHWLIVVEKPEGDQLRDELIDHYIKTLAQVVGSEEEARMKIYSVSTQCYYAFGALVSEELSYKLKEIPHVRWVLPDSYLDVKNKDYGGEPFINGQAVPYDPKYHEEWRRNNARANERNRRNDRPRNFDRSRNFERRRENTQQQNRMGGPPGNAGGPPPSNAGGPPPNAGGPPPGNAGGPPPNMGGAQNTGGGFQRQNNMGGGIPPQNNMGGFPPQNNMGGGIPPQNNMGGFPPQNNIGGGFPPQNNIGGGFPPQNNMGGGMHPPNNMGVQQSNIGGASNMGQMQNGNYGRPGGTPPSREGMSANNMPNNEGYPYQSGSGPNRDYQTSYPQNTSGGNTYKTQDMPGRDMAQQNYQ